MRHWITTLVRWPFCAYEDGLANAAEAVQKQIEATLTGGSDRLEDGHRWFLET